MANFTRNGSVMEKNVRHEGKWEVKKLVNLGLLAALGVVLMLLIRVPVMGFLEYDPADIPILIGTLIYGPGAGFILTLVISGIQAMSVSAGSGIIGFFMHVIATGSMVIVTGLIYGKSPKTISWVLVSIVCGSAAMVGVMVINNLFVTPYFLGVPLQAVKEMMFPVIIPFNVIKALINSTVSFIIAKPLEKSGLLTA